MAEDLNKKRNIPVKGNNPGRAGKGEGKPKTTETGGQNNGGQTERASDKEKRQKHGGR